MYNLTLTGADGFRSGRAFTLNPVKIHQRGWIRGQISRVLKQEGGDLEAVKKKFSSSKFGSVASMKVNVLPDDLP